MSRYPGTIGLPKPLWITQFRPDKGGPDNARTTASETFLQHFPEFDQFKIFKIYNKLGWTRHGRAQSKKD